MLSPSKAGQTFLEGVSPQDHPRQQMYGSSLPRKTSFHWSDSRAVSEVCRHLNRVQKILKIVLRCTPSIFTCIFFFTNTTAWAKDLSVHTAFTPSTWPAQSLCWPGHTTLTWARPATLLTWAHSDDLPTWAHPADLRSSDCLELQRYLASERDVQWTQVFKM